MHLDHQAAPLPLLVVMKVQTGTTAVAATLIASELIGLSLSGSIFKCSRGDFLLGQLNAEVFLSKTIKRRSSVEERVWPSQRVTLRQYASHLLLFLGEFWRTIFEPGVCHVLF